MLASSRRFSTPVASSFARLISSKSTPGIEISYVHHLNHRSLLIPLRSILQGGYAHPLTRTWQGKRPLDKSMFMYPIFITDDPNASVEIPSLPGQRRWGVHRLEEFLGPLVNKGLRSVILFGVPVKSPKVSLARSIDAQVAKIGGLGRTSRHNIDTYLDNDDRTKSEPRQTMRRDRSFKLSSSFEYYSRSSTWQRTCASANTRLMVTAEFSSMTIPSIPLSRLPALPTSH